MTDKQSAALLHLNKQAQVVALNAVGFSDITESSRASEFGQRIKWTAGLLDLNLVCNRISDNSRWYFIRGEWNSFTIINEQLFVRRGLRIRAHGHSFVIPAQKCYSTNMTTTFYWGGQDKAMDGPNQKGLGAIYDCFTGEEDADLIITTLEGQNNSGVIGTPAAEAARTYRAYALESDGIEDESNWFPPPSGQILLIYRYRDKINEMMRTFWSSGSMLMTDKYYWSSTIWNTNSAWAFELNTRRITNQNKNPALLHVRAITSEQY